MGSIALKAFAAAIAGGMFSFAGSIVAGFGLGILENLISFYLTSAYRDVISYALIVGVLLIRPQGLFARK
jgi:branched-chain amino acid transport system permease protein